MDETEDEEELAAVSKKVKGVQEKNQADMYEVGVASHNWPQLDQ